MTATIPFDVHNRWTGEVTAEAVRALLNYDPATGVFTYRLRPAQRCRVGDVAGSVNGEGYRQIVVGGKRMKAHRLAWLYVYGEHPTGLVDHMNGERDDNRIANLRLASRSENAANSTVQRKGKPLPKGVGFRKSVRRWTARIQRNGVSRFLGLFDSPGEASRAYATAASETFGTFSRSA